MCSNATCAMRGKCYRYRAIPEKYEQKYEYYRTMGNGECPKFWDIIDYVTSRLRPVNDIDLQNFWLNDDPEVAP